MLVPPFPETLDDEYRSVWERLYTGCEVDANGCWIWMRSVDTSDYGRLYCIGRLLGAHKVSWILHNGDVPDGVLVLHRCDVRRCVNPRHLFLGTHQSNSDDCIAKGRDKHVSGEQHGNAILTMQEIVIIRSRLAAGETQVSVAKDFGVCQAHVSRIQRGKSWSHG